MDIDKATQTMIDNLRKNTGRTLEEWILVVNTAGLEKHGEIVKLLKTEHGLTHGFANLIAHKAKGSDAGSAEDGGALIEAQYQGKEHLRPIYDRLIGAAQSFGNDVEIAPKKGYVSLRRKKQFAILQPSTKTRFDLGLNMKGVEPKDNLEPSGSFNAMCSHRVKLASETEVDEQVVEWMRVAYEQAG